LRLLPIILPRLCFDIIHPHSIMKEREHFKIWKESGKKKYEGLGVVICCKGKGEGAMNCFKFVTGGVTASFACLKF
jgi:hypothetical protein